MNVVPLKNLTTLVSSGSTPLGGAKVYLPKGKGSVMLIRSQNVLMRHLDLEDVAYITDETASKMKRTVVMNNDVLLNITGASIGRVTCIEDQDIKANVNQHVCILRTNPSLLHYRYLMHFLAQPSFQARINSTQNGGTRQAITFEQIRRFKIPLPPLEEQKHIAAILDKADAIRRKRKKAIRLTEELLRSTFFDMFGDPVTNPKGWETKPLGEFLTTIIDYRGKTPKKSSSGIPLISAANIHDGKVDLSHQQYISERDYAVWTTRGFTKPGDVLITTEAPVGEVAPYPDTGTYQISRRIMALRPNTKLILPSFLLHTMVSKNWLERLRRVTRGSTVPRVLKPDILGQPIPCVSLETQEKFDNFVQRYKKLTQNEESIPQELDNLFNSLLQKAFRGEL